MNSVRKTFFIKIEDFFSDLTFVGVKKLKIKFVKKFLLFEKAMGKVLARVSGILEFNFRF